MAEARSARPPGGQGLPVADGDVIKALQRRRGAEGSMLAGELYRANDPERATRGGSLLRRFGHRSRGPRRAVRSPRAGPLASTWTFARRHDGLRLPDPDRRERSSTADGDPRCRPRDDRRGRRSVRTSSFSTHPLDPELRRSGGGRGAITIGDNVWPAGGSLSGRHDGQDTVVGAGAVVTAPSARRPAGQPRASDPLLVRRSPSRRRSSGTRRSARRGSCPRSPCRRSWIRAACHRRCT